LALKQRQEFNKLIIWISFPKEQGMLRAFEIEKVEWISQGQRPEKMISNLNLTDRNISKF
jgi:hypothetical protein